MSMSIGDICAAAWGLLVFMQSSRRIWGEGETLGGCRDWKTGFFYYATATVITSHVAVALSCATVAVLLTRGVGSQLEELRHLV